MTTLSDEKVEAFYRDGVILVPGLATLATIDRVLEAARSVAVDPTGLWTPTIFNRDKPTTDSAIHELLIDPPIVAAVEKIFEAPARVFYGMLAVVPARGGKGLEWHQDNMYTMVLGRALNCFVALCDITLDKAILWVAPRSHLQGVVANETVDGHRRALEPVNGQPLPVMRKGDVCIFDRNTLHHSRRNDTDENRYAYAAQYIEEKARLAETGQHDKSRLTARELAALWAPETRRATAA